MLDDNVTLGRESEAIVSPATSRGQSRSASSGDDEPTLDIQSGSHVAANPAKPGPLI